VYNIKIGMKPEKSINSRLIIALFVLYLSGVIFMIPLSTAKGEQENVKRTEYNSPEKLETATFSLG
jgi:hypothetical protein